MAFNFKKAEDVQGYLKNIYIEYKFGCESEKDGNACHLLGDYMESIKKNFKEAANIYKDNCDMRNWSKSCEKFAGYRALGKGCTADTNDAYKYMKKSCDLGHPTGCVRAGIMALSNNVFEDDRTTQVAVGMKMLSKSCRELKEPQGCYNLSGVYMGSMKDEVEPNFVEGYKLCLIACEAGNPYACANLSQMHDRGEGVEKNSELAKSFQHRAVLLHRELKESRPQLQFGVGIPT